jgi:hypothetical protein
MSFGRSFPAQREPIRHVSARPPRATAIANRCCDAPLPGNAAIWPLQVPAIDLADGALTGPDQETAALAATTAVVLVVVCDCEPQLAAASASAVTPTATENFRLVPGRPSGRFSTRDPGHVNPTLARHRRAGSRTDAGRLRRSGSGASLRRRGYSFWAGSGSLALERVGERDALLRLI